LNSKKLLRSVINMDYYREKINYYYDWPYYYYNLARCGCGEVLNAVNFRYTKDGLMTYRLVCPRCGRTYTWLKDMITLTR